MDEENSFATEDEGISNEWLATYGDLVTLLMCFFVLLYSMAVIDQSKAKTAMKSLNTIGILGAKGDIKPNMGNSLVDFNATIAINEEQKMDKLHNEVKELIEKNNLKEDVEVRNQANGVLIRFKDYIIYDTGSADLKPAAKETLTQVSQILKKYNKKIKIEGHTDNIPIQGGRYENNWELSAARAISVVRFFSSELPKGQQIAQQNFEVSGYGEYRPIALNDTEKNRQKNRRIEILIIK